MKRFSIFCLLLMLAGVLFACKSAATEKANPVEPYAEDYIQFQEEAPEMSAADAQAYLQSENIDERSSEYRQAVYAVNEAQITSVIDAAHAANAQTDALKKVFSGIAFRFIEGTAFSSTTVQRKLQKEGTYAPNGDDGYYSFTFYDRTLAQTAVNLNDTHALEEYTKVLNLLLSDPNVVVKTLNN